MYRPSFQHISTGQPQYCASPRCHSQSRYCTCSAEFLQTYEEKTLAKQTVLAPMYSKISLSWPVHGPAKTDVDLKTFSFRHPCGSQRSTCVISKPAVYWSTQYGGWPVLSVLVCDFDFTRLQHKVQTHRHTPGFST